MRGKSTAAAALPTRQMAGQTAERLIIFAVMRAVRSYFRHKPSEHLAQVLDCDVETARRYFAGKRAPNGEAMIAMLRHPVGIAMIEEATRDLPPADYRNFWNEMGMAALRAAHREQLSGD